MSGPTRRERAEGGLVGLLVGDALGVPYEFSPPEAIPAHDRIEMAPPPGFRRAHGRIAPGTWSDDGALALALLASLLDLGALDTADLAARFRGWFDEGAYAVDGVVFDVGIQTREAIEAHRLGVDAERAGGTSERSNGNGSLMRVLPLALFHRGDDASLVRDAMRQSTVTHGHPRSQVCCALYCLWARELLDGAEDGWAEATVRLRACLPDGEARRELELHVRPDETVAGRGTGYVVDSLHSTRMVLRAEATYEGAVRAAIALGHDTDTTACIAGGLAGIRAGAQGIPARWRSSLRGREILDPLLGRLLYRAAT
jgi:ADP-ribosylglycohydrolase